MQKIFGVSVLFVVVLYTGTTSGIDNPDAPDYVNVFLNQARAYEDRIAQEVHGTLNYVQVYAEYEEFLDKELNIAYRLIMRCLDSESQASLQQSQRRWLMYRDAEFDFITRNWNKTDYGSSAVISRGGYRTMMIKHRVTTLLHYLKNYHHRKTD